MFGVLQQRFNLATSGFATDLNRQASVATSGLLLIKADPANLQSQNDALKVDAAGRSSSAGGAGAVTVDGTTPIVRHRVLVGGINEMLSRLGIKTIPCQAAHIPEGADLLCAVKRNQM